MPTPLNPELYKQVKAEADKKFLAPTSAYKSAWITRRYTRLGGLYKDDRQKKGLTQWFKEKWVDLTRPKKNGKGYEECGRPRATASEPGKYPLCRPMIRVAKDTPRTVSEVPRSIIVKNVREKQKVREKGRVSFLEPPN